MLFDLGLALASKLVKRPFAVDIVFCSEEADQVIEIMITGSIP